MRPGQEAPDEQCTGPKGTATIKASMRPGQEAPDEQCTGPKGTATIKASMRPGQEAPDEDPFTCLMSAIEGLQ